RRGWIAALLRGRARAPAPPVGELQPYGNLLLFHLVERVAPAGLAALHLELPLLDEHHRDRAGLALPLEAAAPERAPFQSRGQLAGPRARGETRRVVHGERRAVQGRISRGSQRWRRDLVGQRILLGARLERRLALLGVGGRRGVVLHAQAGRLDPRQPRDAHRIGRVPPAQHLVLIGEAVLVGVDADALAAARRDARVGDLLPGCRRDAPQLVVAQGLAAEVGLEGARDEHRAALLAALRPLRHQVAVALSRARDQEIDAVADRRRAALPERDLLPHDGLQVRVEGEHELLDLAALRVACGPRREAGWVREREAGRIVVVEDGGVVEAEEGVHAAVVQEAEAADLCPLVAVVAGVQERNRCHAEHADLLVRIAEVRDLE